MWLGSCCCSRLSVLTCLHWAGPILGHTEVPGADVGGDEGDLESKLTLAYASPSPHALDEDSTMRPLSLVYRWEKPGKHWAGRVCKEGETET